MPKLRRRFLGLCLLPILLTCLDNGLTLSGQPKEYWAGNYAKAIEGNRWHYQLLAHHPLALVAEEAASMLVFVGMILLMPQTLALTISIAATLGYMSAHQLGCYTGDFVMVTRCFVACLC